MVLKALGLALAALLLAAAGFAAFVYSGAYDVGADAPHTRPVHALLDLLRERSIERRARRIDPPDLAAPALVRQGAGNYDAMCASCHLAPGSAETELRRGLYPAPPALAKTGVEDPAEAFWAIKHGIKSSGMPAWGRSMDDEAIWGLVALLQQLPKLDAASYRELVVSSQGHSHGPAEPGEHEHHH